MKKLVIIALSFLTCFTVSAQELPLNIQSALISKMLPYCRTLSLKPSGNEVIITLLYTSSEGKPEAEKLSDGISKSLSKIGERNFKIKTSEFSGVFKNDIGEESEIVIYVNVTDRIVKYYENVLTKKNVLTIQNFISNSDDVNTVIALSVSDQSKPIIYSSKSKLQEHNIDFSSDFLKVVKFK